jgi:hypothetical protein
MKLLYSLKRVTTPAFVTIIILMQVSCSSEDPKVINNPNSNEYSKLNVDQDKTEEEKIAEKNVKERRIYSKFTSNIIESGGNEVLAETIRFDDEGKKTEQYRYSSSRVEVQWLNDYDEFGNLKTVEEYDGFQKLLKRTYFNYNSKGTLLDKRIDNKNNKTYFEYEYDDSLNLINVNVFNTDRILYSKTLYKYSDEKLDSVIFYRNNLVSQIITLDYDSLDRRIGENTIIKDRIIEKVKYEYDEDGNLKTIANPKTATIKNIFDKKGNVIDERYFDASGNMQSRITFEYNAEDDLLSKKVKYDGLNRPALEIRYEYDFH